ncbi:hypothetical protein [Streptomyces sp. NPDC005244]|uniref:hypothetical protein n=1 Tax=Streptomyces sp. NPDC005244 TaxID=3364708 RepID=UPI0036BE36B0
MNHQPREQHRQQRCGRGVRASGPAGSTDATTRAKTRAVTVTDTPWAPDPAGPALHALPSPGPALHPAGPHGQGLGPAADLTPGRAAELAVAAESAGGQARELARRLALSLSPEARGILLSALTEADPYDVYDDEVYGDDGDGVYGYDVGVYEVDGEGGYGDEDAYDSGAYDSGAYGSGGGPLAQVSGAAAASSPAGLRLVPARLERGAGRVSGRAGPGGGAPAGVVRLRFADVVALDRAGAAFGAGPGGGAVSDPATLTLQIPGEAGTETLRAVLEVLDAAALTAESLTVHSHELDDVFSALTGLS